MNTVYRDGMIMSGGQVISQKIFDNNKNIETIQSINNLVSDQHKKSMKLH